MLQSTSSVPPTVLKDNVTSQIAISIVMYPAIGGFPSAWEFTLIIIVALLAVSFLASGKAAIRLFSIYTFIFTFFFFLLLLFNKWACIGICGVLGAVKEHDLKVDFWKILRLTEKWLIRNIFLTFQHASLGKVASYLGWNRINHCDQTRHWRMRNSFLPTVIYPSIVYLLKSQQKKGVLFVWMNLVQAKR
jgi:hypothetical protein